MPAADPGPVAAELRNASGLAIQLLLNGSILAIRHGDVLVNQVLGSPLEGGIGNVYLRQFGAGEIASVPVIGPASASGFHAFPDRASWVGTAGGLEYVCTLRLAPSDPTWYWTIRLLNRSDAPLIADAVLAQDLGLAHEATVRSSELYTSQYIDHTILED